MELASPRRCCLRLAKGCRAGLSLYSTACVLVCGQVQLFVGNLTPEWSDDSVLRKHMEAYGPLERCFVLRNGNLESKVSFSMTPCWQCIAGSWM